MPELPEVETTRLSLLPGLVGQTIDSIIVRNPSLRLRVAAHINEVCKEQQILAITRRSKYLIFHLTYGYLIVHLGMSGHLRLLSGNCDYRKHDHIELQLKNGLRLRYHDPRRFGLWLYIDSLNHSLFNHLGPEPLSRKFNKNYLFKLSRNKKQAVKTFIMNSKNVVGVGNIYANESLFLAQIHPKTPTGLLNSLQVQQLVKAIKKVLTKAIAAGGTTLKDFVDSRGKLGYFSQQLQVYGRENQPCLVCNYPISYQTIAKRRTNFCSFCQKICFNSSNNAED